MQSLLRTSLRLVALALGVVLGVAVVPSPPASAHTELIASDPKAATTLRQPPAQVTLTFNEPMDSRLAVVALTIGDREPARLDVAPGPDATELVATIPDGMVTGGTWRVTFRVTSADGHPVQGDLAFSVEEPIDVRPDQAQPAAPSGPPPAQTSADADVDRPGPVLIAGAVGGGVLLLSLVLFLVARYLRVEES